MDADHHRSQSFFTIAFLFHRQYRIFTKGFFYTRPTRITSQIEHGSIADMSALQTYLFADCFSTYGWVEATNCSAIPIPVGKWLHQLPCDRAVLLPPGIKECRKRVFSITYFCKAFPAFAAKADSVRLTMFSSSTDLHDRLPIAFRHFYLYELLEFIRRKISFFFISHLPAQRTKGWPTFSSNVIRNMSDTLVSMGNDGFL